MRTITLDRARDDLVKVAEEAARAPVRIEDAGGHNVVVMSDELYGRLHRILVQQLKESMDRIGEEADLVTISSSVRAARDPDDDWCSKRRSQVTPIVSSQATRTCWRYARSANMRKRRASRTHFGVAS